MHFQIVAGALCLDFINTLDNRADPERLQELLSSYDDLIDWATQAGAIDASMRTALCHEAKANPAKARVALTAAVELREVLHRILEAELAGRRIVESDRRALNMALGRALSHRELQSTRTGFRLDWSSEPSNLEAVLWPIVDSAGQLLTSPDLERVRECGESKCRWLFVDRSKNHSRRWCDMKVCGNRAKVRKFYRRAKKNSHSAAPRLAR